MTLLTIVEASKQFKIARSYLYKKINDGELSTQLNENGTKVIQYVDLVRIFGENHTKSLRTNKDSHQLVLEDNKGQYSRSIENNKKISEDIVILLKEQISELKKDKEEMTKRLDDMSSKHDKLLLLIEYKAFSTKNLNTTENSHQPVLEDNKGQYSRSTKNNKNTNPMLIIVGIFIIVLLTSLIIILCLKFSNII